MVYPKALLAAVALALLACPVMGWFGGDVTQPVSTSQFDCLAADNGNFVVARVFDGSSGVDSTGAATLAAAQVAGLLSVEGYMIPCQSCSWSAASQVNATVAALNKAGVFHVDILWVVVDESSEWSSNMNENANFISAIINAANELGLTVGFGTDHTAWTQIVSQVYSASQYLLWYQGHDGQPNFNDFVPFAGWTKPFRKRFAFNITTCDVTYNLSFQPGGVNPVSSSSTTSSTAGPISSSSQVSSSSGNTMTTTSSTSSSTSSPSNSGTNASSGSPISTSSSSSGSGNGARGRAH
eukprot:a508717_204.p1 GENE.a508717_204~~a508717_204.p1  ORF type:complete len:309 (-),score=128.10 a508717_204:45-932(-)